LFQLVEQIMYMYNLFNWLYNLMGMKYNINFIANKTQHHIFSMHNHMGNLYNLLDI